MATIKCKGLTGVVFDLTVTMGSTTMNGLTALAQAVEGSPVTTAMYGDVRADSEPSINQTNNGSDTLTAAGIAEGDLVICVADQSGNKEVRQEYRGAFASAKRKGLAAADTNAAYYRAANTWNKTRLPNPYEANAYNPDYDENTGTLDAGRPWT